MGSLASPQILVSLQETAKYRFGLRGQMERRAQRWLVRFNSMLVVRGPKVALKSC